MEFFAVYGMFLIPILVGVTAEVVKFINFSRKHGWDFHYSVTYGHMPSAHTAFVASTVTTLGFYEGFDSPVFALALILAIIVVMDALRLRVYMGQHAQYINSLIHKLDYSEEEFPRLKERVGHKPEEVAAGAVFGIPLTVAILKFGLGF
jgi:acid phosphatase family membrane protein YuiD